MLKKIEYEARKIEDVVIDLADEIKNGWRVCSFSYPNVHIGCVGEMDMTVEITLRKEF